MSLERYFSIWDKLSENEQNILSRSATKRFAPKGTILHNGSVDCVGLFLIRTGLVRAYLYSEEGKEVTLYRLVNRDICLFSASCLIKSLQFEIIIQAEKDCELWVIPVDIYKKLMTESAVVANYTNELMASRISEIMWLIEQIVFKSFDKRLATFMLSESSIENSKILEITHEQIASHLGSAREVVTRMLRYFQNEGIVSLSRGSIEILDEKRLRDIL